MDIKENNHEISLEEISELIEKHCQKYIGELVSTDTLNTLKRIVSELMGSMMSRQYEDIIKYISFEFKTGDKDRVTVIMTPKEDAPQWAIEMLENFNDNLLE